MLKSVLKVFLWLLCIEVYLYDVWVCVDARLCALPQSRLLLSAKMSKTCLRVQINDFMFAKMSKTYLRVQINDFMSWAWVKSYVQCWNHNKNIVICFCYCVFYVYKRTLLKLRNSKTSRSWNIQVIEFENLTFNDVIKCLNTNQSKYFNIFIILLKKQFLSNTSTKSVTKLVPWPFRNYKELNATSTRKNNNFETRL